MTRVMLLGRILVPAAHLRPLGWVSIQAGWFTPTLISLNEVSWEMCAMCGFSKLSVTNAAATLPPSHMFQLFPVLKKQIVCSAKLLNLIASSPAQEKSGAVDTNWMLLVLVVQNGSKITRFCMFVPLLARFAFTYCCVPRGRNKEMQRVCWFFFSQGFNNNWEDLDYCWLGLSVWCGLEEMNPSSGRGRGSGSLLALGCGRG